MEPVSILFASYVLSETADSLDLLSAANKLRVKNLTRFYLINSFVQLLKSEVNLSISLEDEKAIYDKESIPTTIANNQVVPFVVSNNFSSLQTKMHEFEGEDLYSFFNTILSYEDRLRLFAICSGIAKQNSIKNKNIENKLQELAYQFKIKVSDYNQVA